MPTAPEFAQHRFADGAGVFAAYKSFDGQTALRSGGNHAQFTQALQRHAQGTRDRGGGEGEYVNFGAHLFHALFVAHAKAVFFVNDEQAKVFKMCFFAEQFMCTDNNINGTAGQTFQCSFGFFGAAKAAQFGNAYGPVGKTFDKAVIMLFCE